jgi:hypothetical protein
MANADEEGGYSTVEDANAWKEQLHAEQIHWVTKTIWEAGSASPPCGPTTTTDKTKKIADNCYPYPPGESLAYILEKKVHM